MLIRRASINDAENISHLVLTASVDVKEQDFSDAGWALLEQTNSKEAVTARFSQTNYFALICEVEGEVAGYIAMLDHEKIDHLFVYSQFRRKGIATALWRAALRECEANGNHFFWVKSSSLAIPTYASFGFAPVGLVETSNGISFQLMERGNK